MGMQHPAKRTRYTMPPAATSPTANPTNSMGLLDVLAMLRSALTELDASLRFVVKSCPNCSVTLVAVNSGGTEPPPPQQPLAEAKAKFSSITGPKIYYDGESQKCIFNCWTVLNTNRGVLQKQIKSKRNRELEARLAICEANYGCSDADDEVEADNGASLLNGARRKHRPPQEAAAETSKSLLRRLDEKVEGIDKCLGEAVGACEKTATDLLKGDGCICHVDSITAPMMKAVGKINAELPCTEELDDRVDPAAESPPKEELPHKATESPPKEGPRPKRSCHTRPLNPRPKRSRRLASAFAGAGDGTLPVASCNSTAG